MGCQSEESALRTGTGECAASSYRGMLAGGRRGQTRAPHAYLDLGVVSDAREDALAHAADDEGGVAHGLVDAELDVVAAEEQRLAAEEGRARLRCDARAGGALGEEQRDGFEEEGLRGELQFFGLLGEEPGLGAVFEAERVGEHAVDLCGREVRQRHQVARGSHRGGGGGGEREIESLVAHT